MSEKRDTFLTNCYHEAGHAIAARHSGFPVKLVHSRCVEYGREWHDTGEPYEEWHEAVVGFIAAIVGGWLADARYAPDEEAARFDGDLKKLKACLAHIRERALDFHGKSPAASSFAEADVGTRLERGIRKATKAVIEHWDQIEALAKRMSEGIDPAGRTDEELRELTRVEGEELAEFIK